MEIKYSNLMAKNLKDERTIKRIYGQLYDKIIHSLSILFLVDNLSLVPDTPPTKRHKLEGNYNGMFAISLSVNYRMIINPLNGDNNLKSITSIEIVDIIDYH